MQDISLYDLLKYYVKKWRFILVITAICFGLGIIYSNFIKTPLYKSDATLLIVRSNVGNQDVSLINNYVELFKSRRILEPVIEKVNVGMTYDELVDYVEASSEKNTDVIKVSVSTSNAQKSKEFVKQAVVSFKENVSSIYTLDNVKIVDDASIATEPYNINHIRVYAIAVSAGFLTSLIALFFMYDHKNNKLVKITNVSDQIIAPKVEVQPILEASVKAVATCEEKKPTQLSEHMIIQEHKGMNYANRSEWIRAMYSRERQPKR